MLYICNYPYKYNQYDVFGQEDWHPGMIFQAKIEGLVGILLLL
jgi:hypothetical protein